MTEPISITEAAAGVRAGRLSPPDLVERCLGAIREHEDQVHAWVVVDEAGAREAARQRADELAGGRPRGPLHGIPVGIKDIVDVQGLPTRAGSLVTSREARQSDAPLVAAFRQAGAIILGKTVTCEFACFDPSPTRNPWDPACTPGGSSSGSAAAVALGMCLGAIGTQTGGSLVRPASYCGVAAMKPTYGRVSTEGVVPASYHLDHPGPIARSAADLEPMLRALVSHEPEAVPIFKEGGWGQPQAAPSAVSWGRADQRFASVPVNPSHPPIPPRLGLVEEYFLEEADEAIRRATAAAVERLSAGGARVRPAALPESFADVHRLHRTIMAVEVAAVHRRRFQARREAYGPRISALVDEGLAVSAVEYAEALAHQREFRREVPAMLEAHDALIMPATDTTAPRNLATTGDSKFQAPWSYAGLPTVSIPCGLAADGMPAAIQLVGRPGEDFAALKVAQWCEERLEFRAVPPRTG